MVARFGGKVISGRYESLAVRGEAVASYLAISAQIGIVESNSSTFRQALAPLGECSQWWFHPVSFKDCEEHPILEWMISLFVIVKVMENTGAGSLVLFGAPAPIVEVLRQKGVVSATGVRSRRSGLALLIKGFGSRLRYLFSTLRLRKLAHRSLEKVDRGFDVLLTGFWGTSITWNDRTESLSDRYFKALPERLEQRGMKVGWLAAMQAEQSLNANSLLDQDERVIGLQGLLGRLDILRTTLSFSALITFLKWKKCPAFQEAFSCSGYNLYPLFSETLLHHFAGRAIPHCRLLASASERACRIATPEVTLSYLEHHLFGRAHYEGVRRSGSRTRCMAMQHASVSRELTFYALHPKIEFAGEPDGEAIPHPAEVFAMGDSGRRMFFQWGYSDDQVVATGAARFDGVRFDRKPASAEKVRAAGETKPRILMVPSLADDIEIDMVEAVCCALEQDDRFELCLRKHPFSQLDKHPRYQMLADRIMMTSGDLAVDIDLADLIVFTYSTVADEAFLAGKPCWQWLPLGFDGSALVEVTEIPRFSRVTELTEAFEGFLKEPERYVPTIEERQHVASELFGPADGKAAERIAESIGKLMTGNSREPKGQSA